MSSAAARLFAASALFKENKTFACYWPNKSEFNPIGIIEAIIAAKKPCYLPVISDQVLTFRAYTKDAALVPNRYGILEPKSTEILAAEQLDIVIMPLVAFDARGNRLGTGGGYYDKTFAFKSGNHQSKPLLVGLGYEAQQAEKIPHESWDIKLDAVLTEKRIVLFKYS